MFLLVTFHTQNLHLFWSAQHFLENLVYDSFPITHASLVMDLDFQLAALGNASFSSTTLTSVVMILDALGALS